MKCRIFRRSRFGCFTRWSATATFRLLYALIVLGHDRRRIIHFEVTQNPTQVWLARQMTEAFPWDTAPRYLLPDRDASYGQTFRDRSEAIARMRRALAETEVRGVATTAGLHERILTEPSFIQGRTHVTWLREVLLQPQPAVAASHGG